MKTIPLIIPNFNQLTYTKQLVDWWLCHTNEQVWILDQKSTYGPLLDWYAVIEVDNDRVCRLNYPTNAPRQNLAAFLSETILKTLDADFYCISDPDILPCDDTPDDFLELFQYCIERMQYHHAGFSLKLDDLPDYEENKGGGCQMQRSWIMENERRFWQRPIPVRFRDRQLTGFQAPIDTTFAMYRRAAGWPPKGSDWDRAMRICTARHQPWYIDPKNLTDEQRFYFSSCTKSAPGAVTLANNYRPKEYV